MADFSASAKSIGTTGQTRVVIQHNRPGIQWVVSQISVEVVPTRISAIATIRRNGRFLTDTTQTPAAATGQPFYRLHASDQLTADFVNLFAGDTCIVTVSYQEGPIGMPLDGVVV